MFTYLVLLFRRSLLFLASILLLGISTPSIAKPTLTIYTYDSFSSSWGPGPALKQRFETQCNCNLKLVPLADGVALLNRLRMEGQKTKADVVVGLDNNLIEAATQTGLFTQHNVDSAAISVPDGWNNATFLPYDYSYFAFEYNQERVKNPPQSLKALIESKNPWTLIYQDPRTSTPGLGLLLWMKKVYGDQAPNAWKQLAKKTVTVTKGWSEAYSLFLQGEADFVLTYTTSPAVHIITEKDNRYRTANFKEGHYLQVEVAAKLANSKQSKLADQFLAFLISPETQKTLVTTNWMYPATKISLPKGFEQLETPQKTLQFDAKELEENRAKWVKEWQSALAK